MLRELTIKEQHQVGRKTKVTSFFSPVRRSTFTASDNPKLGAGGDFKGFTIDKARITSFLNPVNSANASLK